MNTNDFTTNSTNPSVLLNPSSFSATSNVDFTALAQQATSLCYLMQGREKLITDEVVDKTLTIIAFDFAPKFDDRGEPVVNPDTGETDTYGVVAFKEMPGKYYAVGVVFTKVCHAWADAYDGNPELASQVLSNSGGVKVKFVRSRTKGGRNLVNVRILGNA